MSSKLPPSTFTPAVVAQILTDKSKLCLAKKLMGTSCAMRVLPKRPPDEIADYTAK